MEEPADAQLTTPPIDRSLRLIFGQIPGAIWATDRDLRITWAEGTVAFRGIEPRQARSRTVAELVDVGRIRSGQLLFAFEKVDLRAVVSDVAARFASDIERSGSSLSIHADAAVVGDWDPYRVDQVATNLLENAVKFGEGKPIAITVNARNGTAVMIVEDHGMGIPSEKLEHIFEPFERAVSIRHYGGLGLGLHLVRVIVDGLHGTVRVDSQPGVGSTFTVELPRSRTT